MVPPGNEEKSTKVLKISGHRLTDQPAAHVFQSLDFVGNPKISTYQDGELQSVRTYRPIPVKKPEPWPPLTIWLVFNDVLLGIFGLIYIARVLVRYATSGPTNASVSS